MAPGQAASQQVQETSLPCPPLAMPPAPSYQHGATTSELTGLEGRGSGRGHTAGERRVKAVDPQEGSESDGSLASAGAVQQQQQQQQQQPAAATPPPHSKASVLCWATLSTLSLEVANFFLSVLSPVNWSF